MNMNYDEVVLGRRSIRGYKSEPVPPMKRSGFELFILCLL